MANPSPSTEVFPQVDARLDIDGSTWNLNSITNESVALVAITAASSTAYKIGYLAERPAELNFASSNAAPAISGFTLVTTVAAVDSATKFYVDYDRAFIITASSVSGPVSVTYSGMGSTVRSREINNIHYGHNYLGPKSSAPTVDNEGSALAAGDQYYNTTDNKLYIRTSANEWKDLAVAASGNTITSADGYNLTLTTDADGENVVINSTTGTSGNTILLPKVRATEDDYVLSMKDKTTGETEWTAVKVAPQISAITWYSDSSYSTVLPAGQEVNINPSPTVTTGTLGDGTAVVTLVTTTNLNVGDGVSGTGINSGVTIISINTAGASNDGTITLSATNAGTGSQSLTFTPTGASISYLKVAGEELGSSGVFGTTSFVQIINTTQSSVSVGDNEAGLTGCVTAATHTSTTEWRFTINPTGVSNIAAGDVLKVKAVTSGGNDIFTSGYTVSADPTSTTTVSSATVVNTASVGSFGGLIAGGGADADTKFLLNFDRANGSTDFEDSSNVGGHGHKVEKQANVHIDNTIGAFNGTSSGKANNCSAYFDGTDDYLKVTGTANTKTTDSKWSLDFWVYPQTNSTYGYIVDSRSYSATYDQGFRLYTTTDGATSESYFSLDLGYASSTATRISPSLAKDTWTHVAIQQTGSGSGTTLKGYFNGIQVSSITGVDNDWGEGGSDGWTIGAKHSTTNNFFKGYLDSFRLCFTDDSFTGNFTVPTTIYGIEASTTINSIGLAGAAGADSGTHYVIYNTATLSGSTESTVALPSGLSISPAVGATSTTNAATISGDLTATAGTHAIKLVARVSSDGSAAKIDPNRKTAYTHTITKNAGGAPVLFNVRRYPGDGTVRKITGFGIKPDLVWAKRRDGSNGHVLMDSVRGPINYIDSAENAAVDAKDNMVTAFDTDEVSLGTDSTAGMINYDAKSFVMWGWQAGGVPSGNGKRRVDDSSTEIDLVSHDSEGANNYHTYITDVKQSVNSAGKFSITKYKVNSSIAANAKYYLCHGLVGTPDFVIIKNLTDTKQWAVWHKDFSNTDRGYLNLDDSGSEALEIFWGPVGYEGHTQHAVTLGDAPQTGRNGNEYIMYAWKGVTGVSAFGGYSGNGAERTITTGFAPSFVMIKSRTSGDPWLIYDTARVASGTENQLKLMADVPDGESTVAAIGVTLKTDDGFTIHGTTTIINGSGDSYIWCAFA